MNGDDVDALVGEIVAGTDNSVFDLTEDGAVSDADLSQWLSAAATENSFSPPYLSGDANLDGSVDSADLNNLGQNWLGHPNTWQLGDFNADGNVDVDDLNELGQNWQRAIPRAASQKAVPEPSTATLAVFALAAVLRRRRFIKPNPA